MLSEVPPFVLVVSAPSGTGKTTVVQRLVRDHPGVFHVSVSATTRPPRGEEQDGVAYRFVTHEEFRHLIHEGLLLEWARVYQHFYGTPRGEVEGALAEGRIPILSIDVQGGMQVMASIPGCVGVFLLPPSLRELQRRLSLRGTEHGALLTERLREAPREIEQGLAAYDYIVVNDDLERCVETLWAIITAERARTWRHSATLNEERRYGL